MLALAALTVSIGSLWVSYRNERRLDRQERQEVASKVALNEAPNFAYDQLSPSDSGTLLGGHESKRESG